MHFESLGHFAEHLLKSAIAEEMEMHKGLERCAKLIEKTAKAEIGVYQPEVGPFQDWAELAGSTKEDRTRLGYTDDEPLLRSGELRDSITHETAGLEAVIGSTSPVMAYMEFGTLNAPPRPVMGPAAFRNKEKIRKIVGVSAISGMTKGSLIHSALGYNMEIE